MSNTSLVESLDYAGSGARYDKSAKRIMSFKSVLAWTLKSVCKEFSDLDLKYIERTASETSPSQIRRYTRTTPIERLSLVATRELLQASESVSKKDGTVNFDLRFRVRTPQIMNIEIQNENNPIYRLVSRGIYYSQG